MQLLGSRYRLAEPLGTGGMSVVWRGYDELLGRLVAIKVLSRRSADAETFSGRIRQEAMASARITHPNIAGVYDYGEIDEPDGGRVPYMVMELVEGRSLAHKLAEGPMPWREAVRVCAEVAAALLAAHEAGLVHRDISPANVLLTPAGAKVIDFGISAPVGEPESQSMRLGTPAFIAPERFGKDGLVHPATDVYALGVLLYQSVSGTLPWPAGSVSQLLSHQRYAPPQPLPPVPDLPPAVARLIERCLARDPDQRPDIHELAPALAREADVRLAARVPDEPAVAPTPAPDARTVAHEPDTAADPVGSPPTSSRPVRTVSVGSAGVAPPFGVRTVPVRAGMRRSRRIALAGLAALAVMAAGITVGRAVSRAGTGMPAAAQAAGPARTAGRAPAPLPTSTPPVLASVTGCAVTYHIRNTWNVGFTVDVQVTNTGTSNLSTWTLTFALAADQRIVQGWNGVFSQAGRDVSVRDAGYNGKLQAGGTTTLGFNGSYRQRNPTPVRFQLNGVPCTLQGL